MAVLHAFRTGPRGTLPVLLVHGVTNTGERLRPLAERGLAGVDALVVDLRGHARSTWDPPWHAERHLADIVQTLDHHGIGRCVVAGHSFGGLLATHLAAGHPDRVAAMALIDPAVELPPRTAAAWAEAALTPDSWESVDEARAARAALRPEHARDTVDADLATFLTRGEDGRYRLDYSAPAAVCAWSEMARPAPDLSGFTGRALIVEAGRADFVTDALRDRLRRDLGDRLEETVIDAGHMLFWDAFDEVVAAVRPFVEREVAGLGESG